MKHKQDNDTIGDNFWQLLAESRDIASRIQSEIERLERKHRDMLKIIQQLKLKDND